MKLLKKTAALLFCLALAVSVMAVSAWADDDEDTAELLNTSNGVEIVTNSEFTVMLTKSASSSAIVSHDDVSGYEIDANQQVTFDITVAYTHENGTYDFSGKTIDGFQFDFDPAHNYGATIVAAEVGNVSGSTYTKLGNIQHADDATYFGNDDTYANTYAYSSVTNEGNDLNLPNAGPLSFTYTESTSTEAVTGGTKIGQITLEFTSAVQAINIYPQIENLLFQVRTGQTESPQKLVAATFTSGSGYGTSNNSAPAGTNGSISNGKSGNGSNYHIPTPADTVIIAPVPVIVNPIYTVKLEEFHNDEATGIIAKTTTKVGNADVPVTTDIYYDYLTGSFQNGSDEYKHGSYATVLPNTELYGYTLQGWMVTADTDTSKSWAKYNPGTLTPNWSDTTKSYPATTQAMYGQTQWGTAADTWFSATENAGKVEFNVDTKNGTKNSLNNYPNIQENVNFIAATKGTTEEPLYHTLFPAGLIGNITLTPVYTRDVYTATFNSGYTATKHTVAKFGQTNLSDASLLNVDNTNYRTFDKQYTIENLYDGSNVADFLSLNDTTTGPVGPWGVSQTAYKFMGWTPVSDSTVNDDYKWTRDKDLSNPADDVGDELVDVSAYNNAQVLKTANCKHYGDVAFTAVWEEDIYYAEIGYWYGGNDNVLVLVAVPSSGTVTSTNTVANYSADYTYMFTPNATDGAKKMFIVPKGTVSEGVESGQRAEYVQAAITAAESDTANLEKFTSDITNATEYVLFAYIAKPDDVDQSKVTIDEAVTNNSTIEATATEGVAGTRCANYVLKYEGDVDGSSRINVADFGNVDTLFNNPVDTGTNNTAEVFKVSGDNGYYGVKARLQADVTIEKEQTEEGKAYALKFASIKDIKFIYDLMGYNTNT